MIETKSGLHAVVNDAIGVSVCKVGEFSAKTGHVSHVIVHATTVIFV